MTPTGAGSGSFPVARFTNLTRVRAMKFDVVIAGGGFAGAYCAKALAKAMGHEEGKKRVALIAERNILVFQPMLAEVAGAALSPTDVVNPLRHFCRGVDRKGVV